MGAYHQMGHDSWNLVHEKHLHGYEGIVLSPINNAPETMAQRILALKKKRDDLDIILDPQLYEPRSNRGQLASWPYFSTDVDTVNLANVSWWGEKGQAIVAAAKSVGANAICSPAMLPRIYSDDYYRWTVDCAETTSKHASKNGIDTLITSIVRLSELAQKGRCEAIASILTGTDISRIYLVLSDDLTPRNQRTDVESLAGAIRLIRLLEDAGTEVLVSFSGLDMLLWKAAGATHVASGKFFNLRRFVPGRFEEDNQDGGRVVPYWTDAGLITWLREDDIKLLDKNELIDRTEASSNPFSKEILEILDAGSGEAWVGYGWRQYLYWFQETEAVISSDLNAAKTILKSADALWGKKEETGVYLFDRQNTGDWIRPWLNAIKMGLQDI
ncbi:hypothetical protein [Undibacterium terreum]|uniref:Uncharacterized protein n=1 Tax=Undibacterium terreum TaxID=1224302 RepID=A0A916V0D3_9BURK|nr:hypothetical protein [Undibacterium terreum]GGC98011.1 hypothetical protein GCM10011396_51910 [Undibacterium terreum]